jgi:4-amino-4-deoxy-L-arabinose transferase-like glycosyltransferase
MRFTSLIVELIRARPRLTVWVVLLIQAAIWVVIPTLFYGSPPGDLSTTLAFGREYQVGTSLGPPLAFWMADLAYRAAGNHIVGIYVLAQLCFIITFWLLYRIGRETVGSSHAVVAVLLTMTIPAYSWAGIAFGPPVLARMFWAMALLETWRAVGEKRPTAWFGLAVAAGLLVLTTADAPWLLLMIVLFLVLSRHRRRLLALDPWMAASIALVIALPWLVWLLRMGGIGWPQFAVTPEAIDGSVVQRLGLHAGTSLALLLLGLAGVGLLAAMNARRFALRNETPSTIMRAGMASHARRFVYTFAIVPPLAGSLLGVLLGRPDVVGGTGVVLLMVGLAVVVGTGDAIPLRRQRVLRRAWAMVVILPAVGALVTLLIVPWLARTSQTSAVPSRELAQFFADHFQRRTGRPLGAVAGDTEIAALVALGPTRPHLLIDTHPWLSPWFSRERFMQTGGVIVWRAADTAGAAPPDIAARFPTIVPEVPQTFDSFLNGRQPPARIGWAIVRPRG